LGGFRIRAAVSHGHEQSHTNCSKKAGG
jgi:hypothetical protein